LFVGVEQSLQRDSSMNSQNALNDKRKKDLHVSVLSESELTIKRKNDLFLEYSQFSAGQPRIE
jgi:hypothetical protein